MNLTILKSEYSIYRFSVDSVLPDWIYLSDFYSVTKTIDELSVVALRNDSVSGEILCNKGWRILKIAGPLDFSLVGIIARISEILSDRDIPIFTVSTYDTDYILVRQENLNPAVEALKAKGYNIS